MNIPHTKRFVEEEGRQNVFWRKIYVHPWWTRALKTKNQQPRTELNMVSYCTVYIHDWKISAKTEYFYLVDWRS